MTKTLHVVSMSQIYLVFPIYLSFWLFGQWIEINRCALSQTTQLSTYISIWRKPCQAWLVFRLIFYPGRIEFGKMFVFLEGWKQENPEKNPTTHMSHQARIKPFSIMPSPLLYTFCRSANLVFKLVKFQSVFVFLHRESP